MPILETLNLGATIARQNQARADKRIRQRFVAPRPQQINTVLTAGGIQGTDQCLHIDSRDGSAGVAAGSLLQSSAQNAADEPETSAPERSTPLDPGRLRTRILEVEAKNSHLRKRMPYWYGLS
jgi:hypothetical protein